MKGSILLYVTSFLSNWLMTQLWKQNKTKQIKFKKYWWKAVFYCMLLLFYLID